MLNEDNSDEISIKVESETEPNSKDETMENNNENFSLEEIQELLEKEKQKSQNLENKLKLALADFQNLSKKVQSDIENGVNAKIAQFMIEFLTIYDDFTRAKEIFSKDEKDITGLDSILKNMDSLLEKNNIKPINALGEIFNPNYHEAISIIFDPQLDENTITKEIRKGYISQNRVIRPTLVEISKKQGETKDGENNRN